MSKNAPPDIRRDVCARVEKKKQETNAAHSLHGQVPEEIRLKRECFLSSVRPAEFHAKVILCSEWQHRQNLASHNNTVNLDESLAKGHTSPWAAWRCLNRLRTGVACSIVRDGSTSTETQHASVVRLLKPSSICYNAHYLHIHVLWRTFRSSTKMPENV